MKINLIPAIALGIFYGMASCNENKETSSSIVTDTSIVDSVKPKNNSAIMSNVDTVAMASSFITKAAGGGMLEVELGKIAQQNAVAKDVKDFGAMMVKDHSAANKELMDLVKSKNIMLSNNLGPHQIHVDEMKQKKGVNFDNAYIDMMVSDHQTDIAEFEAAANGADAAVRAYATKTLPVLKKHLDAIKKLQASRKK